jgi:hypothetical protein
VVNETELNQLLEDCPTLYHMAEQHSWPLIREHGLLSTTALLDRYDAGLGRAVVRDQLPMDDGGLRRCLKDGLSPEDWYRLLNAKVFFWFTRHRLLRLLNAGTYRNEEHDVLELEAQQLVAAHRERIWFCPMNSGCTKPFAHPRGIITFQRITDYPYDETVVLFEKSK